MGGGMGIAQGSTLRIVGERTRMAMPEVAIGFFPDVGASYFLSRLPGALGAYLALTGVQIRGADALYCRAGRRVPVAGCDRLAERRFDGLGIGAMIGRAICGDSFMAGPLWAYPHPRCPRCAPASTHHFSHPTVPAILASLLARTAPSTPIGRSKPSSSCAADHPPCSA